MSYKIVDLNESMKMTEKLEVAVTRAFMRDESRTTIEVPRKDHLDAQHVPGLSCKHKWSPINLTTSSAPAQGDWKTFLQQLFDETELGDVQVMCEHCKAFALADKTGDVEKRPGWPDIQVCKIWAYDASASLPPEQPRKEKSGGRDSKRQGRK